VQKAKFGGRLSVENSQNASLHTSRLTLSPLVYTDSGNFTCTDNSSDFTKLSSFYVYVYGKPIYRYVRLLVKLLVKDF